MARRLLALGMLVAMAATIVGAAGTARADENSPGIAPGPPPPAEYETVPVVPGPAYVWVAGYWQWTGRWVWIPGRWEYVPYPGARWVPGRWVRRGYGWVWVSGYWTGGGPGYGVATVPPPPLQTEVAGPPPFVGAVWIGGYWRWAGARWVWVGGYWARRPWPRAVWVPGRWVVRGGGWVWTGGYWR